MCARMVEGMSDKQEWEGQGIFETDCFRHNSEIRGGLQTENAVEYKTNKSVHYP